MLKDTAHLDQEGSAIPRSAPRSEWRNGKTRKLGLKMPRLECTLAEIVFIRLYALNRLDIEKVAGVVRDEFQQDGTDPLLRQLLKRPSVAEWVDRWVRYRRLPAPVQDRRPGRTEMRLDERLIQLLPTQHEAL